MKLQQGTSKHERSDTVQKLAEKWKWSQKDIKAGKFSDACDRFVALEQFRKDYAERKKQRLQAEVNHYKQKEGEPYGYY